MRGRIRSLGTPSRWLYSRASPSGVRPCGCPGSRAGRREAVPGSATARFPPRGQSGPGTIRNRACCGPSNCRTEVSNWTGGGGSSPTRAAMVPGPSAWRNSGIRRGLIRAEEPTNRSTGACRPGPGELPLQRGTGAGSGSPGISFSDRPPGRADVRPSCAIAGTWGILLLGARGWPRPLAWRSPPSPWLPGPDT